VPGDGRGAGVELRRTTEADERLSELLELVFERNPFQRRRVEALALDRSPALADLPPLAKRDLIADQAEHPPFGTNLTFPLERYTHVWQTSGTTGSPLRVLDTADD
jgi:phenylacetate-CoA ligase